MNQNTSHSQTPLDENQQIQVRKEKLAQFTQDNNGLAYRNDFRRDVVAACLKKRFDDWSKEQLASAENKTTYHLAGRIVLKRVMGKAAFVTLQDMSGQIQIYLRKNDLPEGHYKQLIEVLDLGDIIGVAGVLFKTNTGELSIYASQADLLTKSLRPLPDKYHGLHDTESRYRQRYVDLMTNDHSRHVFQVRSQTLNFIRQYFVDKKFMEVETPMMQPIPGGATAKPFETYHNALDMPLYLRIAPELYLKRLVVGGFEQVFEINRNFRNEGVSSRHNPEFTMLEFYQAYTDYQDLMNLTEDMITQLVVHLFGEPKLTYQGDEYDFSGPFERMSLFDAIVHYNETIEPRDIQDLASAKQVAQSLGLKVDQHAGLGKVQTEIFEATVEPYLKGPIFITQYPSEVSPLARRNDQDPSVTDRFEFFIGGREIANGFSELNDPQDQADRFQQQVAAKNAGDQEAMYYDADYIEALEYGLPPTAGEGIGIDRLVMYLTDSPSIRDVILFPHMRYTS